jgi:hypothetical protein
MKLTEKILRAPLPDQLKALLEKFDFEFDTRDLRKLGELSGDRSFTRYERYMLNRTYSKARAEVDRVRALDAAMNIVLNRREEMEESFFDPTRYLVKTGASGVVVPVESLYNAAMGQQAMGLQNIPNTQNIANNKAAQQARGMGMHP